MAIVLVLLAVDIAGLLAVLLIEKGAQRSLVLGSCALYLSVAGACSLGIAAQVLFLPTGAADDAVRLWLALAWTALGVNLLAIVVVSPSPGWVIASPCAVLAAASLMFGLVHREPVGAKIACVMVVAGLLILAVRSKSLKGVLVSTFASRPKAQV